MSGRHPDSTELLRLALGELGEAAAEPAREHIASCERCRREWRMLWSRVEPAGRKPAEVAEVEERVMGDLAQHRLLDRAAELATVAWLHAIIGLLRPFLRDRSRS